MNDSISGQAAEHLVARAAKGSKCKPFTLDTQVQLIALRSIPSGVRRLELAMKYLSQQFDWSEDSMPAQELQDIAFGLDLCVNYRGYRIGIDVTVNVNAIDKKIAQKQAISAAYKAADLDLVVILEVTQEPTAELLSDAVKTAIRGGEFISYAVI